MNLQIRSVVLIFSVALLFCSLFLVSGTGSVHSSSPDEIFRENGMVLGVSEVATGKIRGGSNYVSNFPESKTILDKENQIIIPQKKIDAVEIAIPANSNGVVIDNDSEKLLFTKNQEEVVPIASLTKLMTALVFLDHNPGWDTLYELKNSDRVNGGKIYLYRGDKVRIKDLFHLSLVSSANTATKALVNSTILTEEEFIAEMNKKAKELGLNNTSFVDPIGLSNYNLSTAWEVAMLVRFAMQNKDIAEASLTKEYSFETVQGVKKTVYSTDQLLDVFPRNGIKILGGKTGYTISAGYCFAGVFTNSEGKTLVSAVLGTNTIGERFKETKKIIEWAYENYNWK